MVAFWRVFDTIIGTRTWDGELIASSPELKFARTFYLSITVIALLLGYIVMFTN